MVIVTLYLTARYFLTPQSFGMYGWYRAVALEEIAARPTTYAGQKACDECHSEVVQRLAKYEHKTVSCESCHGTGQAHAENPDVSVAKLTYSHCVRCHEADPARPKWLKQVKSKEHYTGQRCTECHIPINSTKFHEQAFSPSQRFAKPQRRFGRCPHSVRVSQSQGRSAENVGVLAHA
jgi:ribosomal protein L37AE/L43A